MNNSQTPFKKGDVGLSSEKKVKYPFSGFATNLIDKFLVLGYEQKVIDFTFKYLEKEDGDTNKELKTRFKFFEFEERPSIVNEICNDYSKDLLENDLILELIFPNMPQMYFLDNLKITVVQKNHITVWALYFTPFLSIKTRIKLSMEFFIFRMHT